MRNIIKTFKIFKIYENYQNFHCMYKDIKEFYGLNYSK